MPDFEQRERMEEDRERELREEYEEDVKQEEIIEDEIEGAAAREADVEDQVEFQPLEGMTYGTYTGEGSDPDSSAHYSLQYGPVVTNEGLTFALVTDKDGVWYMVEIYTETDYDANGYPYNVERVRIIQNYGYPADTNQLFLAFDDYGEGGTMPDSVTQMGDRVVPDSSWINIDDIDFRYEDYTEWSDGLIGFIPDADGNWYIVDLDGWYADPPGKIILTLPANAFDVEFKGQTHRGNDEDFEGAYIAYLRGGESAMNQFIADRKAAVQDMYRDAQLEQDRLNEERQQAEQDEVVQYWKDRLAKAESDDEADAQEIGRLTIERNVYKHRWEQSQEEIERLRNEPQNQTQSVSPMTTSNMGFLALIGILGVVIYTARTKTEG